MNTNPVMSSKSSDVANPFKLGGYLNRSVEVTAVPSENTTLFSPTISQNRKNRGEWRHNISNVTTATEVKINLGESAAESKLMDTDDKHSTNVNVTMAGVVATPYPGGSLQTGDRGVLEDASSGDDSVSSSSPNEVTSEVSTRGSHVYFGSEDGLVHIRMRPLHPLRKQLRVPEPSSHRYEETTHIASTQETTTHIASTQEMQELSSIIPGVWTTDTPGAEDWTTETPEETLTATLEEGLTNNEEQNTGRIEHQPTITHQDSSTKAPEERPASTAEPNDLSTFTPEEHLTVSPEEWPSTTLQGEDDWLTFMPQEKEQLIGTQEVHLTSLLNPTPLSLSPTLSSSLSPSLTPTLPPSLPPTPSPQDAVEDTFRITTRGLDFLLEASPTGQSSPDSTEFPKDDFTLDLTITTTREGLKVDARDVTFDPSQIAKATSYEGSSYPTATRSATVTTTWVEEDHLTTLDPQSVVVNARNEELVNPSSVGELDDLSTESHQDLESEDRDTSTLPMDDELMLQLDGLPGDGQASDNILRRSDSATLTHPPTNEESNIESTTPPTLPGNTEDQAREQDSTEVPRLTFGYEAHQETNTSGRSLGGLLVLMTNVTDARNGSNSMAKVNDSRVEETIVYEMPVVTRSPGPQLSPSVVVALSVCCAAVVVLAALSVVLWVCRRHRNRSKIYLSREAAKPRAFFTRPMNPAVLPEDSDREDAVYMLEFQRPRPPIMLGDDQKGIYFIKRDEGSEECKASLGVENEAFADVPLGEAGEEERMRLDPPKYDLRSKQDGDADSGIRVWSSTGSLHAAASPLPTHCRVPPPSYSPSISKESVCLTVHSLPSLHRNSQLFDV